MEAFLVQLVSQYPWVMSVVIVLGVFRAIFKPLVALVHAYVEATPSKSDDEKLAAVESSKWFKGLLFIVDYLFSIKLPGR